ncbi:MAG: LamG-like jellyroll fold domain-containing protein [Bacteroidota bacterium]
MKTVYALLIALALATPHVFAQVSADGLVAYFPFNGDALDYSGNNNNGLVVDAWLGPDRYGKADAAYYFNGSSSYIEVRNSESLNIQGKSSITLNVWIKADRLDVQQGIICKWGRSGVSDDQYTMFTPSSLLLPSFILSGDMSTFIAAASALLVDRWYMITCVHDADINESRLYVDGQLSARKWVINSFHSTNEPVRIGRDVYAVNSFFKGALDDIFIFHRALDSDEVETLYRSGAATAQISVEPHLTLSSSTVAPGGSLTVRGSHFSPNSPAKLFFNGINELEEIDLVTDNSGAFAYTMIAPLKFARGAGNNSDGVADALIGAGSVASVYGLDVRAIKTSQVRRFQVPYRDRSSTVHLYIYSPSNGITRYKQGDSVDIRWVDVMKVYRGDYKYPTKGLLRYYDYSVHYSVDGGASWRFVERKQGMARITLQEWFKSAFFAAETGSRYQVKITDNFQPSITRLSDVFSVINDNNISASLEWDYSFPASSAKLYGLAADGVARAYIKILNRGTKNIRNASVALKNGRDDGSAMLGKVMRATVLDKYSNEANAAADTYSQVSNIGKREAWFWYVAPDDFESDPAGTYSNDRMRSVTADIVLEMEDNSTETAELEIQIVRPPLMLVHGINSDEGAFSDFKYHKSPEETVIFTESMLFTRVHAVRLGKGASFRDNATTLLWPSVENGNSIFGNIMSLRMMGFATNRVDYVAHSMGGLVLRTGVSVFHNRFFGLGSTFYRTYNKGLVNKAITINSPHLGSPIANIIVEAGAMIPESALKVFSSWPYNLFLAGFFNNEGPTQAIRDLQVNSAAKINEVKIKHHYIAGDVDVLKYDDLSFLESGLAMRYFYTFLSPFINCPVFYHYGERFNSEQRFMFVERYSADKGFSQFSADGDLIVPLKSQLVHDARPRNCTVFGRQSANHLKILERLDVGDRVKSLLNSAINSPDFGDVIPANQSITRYGGNEKLKKYPVFREFVDTSRIVIESPARNDVYMVDSTIMVVLRVKDTIGLVAVTCELGGQIYRSPSKVMTQVNKWQIDPNWLGERMVIATAEYMAPTGREYYYDTLSITVSTEQPLVGFEAGPEIATLWNDEPHYLTYTALFPTFVADIANDNPDIMVTVDDPSIVVYDAENFCFYGRDTVSTFAVISYKGILDTVYFEVLKNGMLEPELTDDELITGIEITQNEALVSAKWAPRVVTDNVRISFYIDTDIEGYDGVYVGEASYGAGSFSFELPPTFTQCKYHVHAEWSNTEYAFHRSYYESALQSPFVQLRQPEVTSAKRSSDDRYIDVTWLPSPSADIQSYVVRVIRRDGTSELLAETDPSTLVVSVLQPDTAFHSVAVAARDAAGQTGCWSEMEIAFAPDVTPPAIVVIAPQDEGKYQDPGMVMEFDVTDAQSRVDTATLHVTLDDINISGSSQISAISAGYAVQMPVADLTVGPHVLAIAVSDFAGNAAQESVNFDIISEAGIILTPGKVIQNVVIYPNPSRNVLTIVMKDRHDAPSDVSIYSALGVLVRNSEVAWQTQHSDTGASSLYGSLSISDLHPGVYLVVMTYQDHVETESIIKY